MIGRSLPLAAALAGVLIVSVALRPALAAPEKGGVSFRSGVYTQVQADRGLHVYLKNCAACHGDMYNGSESGPPLSDDPFLVKWKGKSLADLYAKMHNTMPPPPDRPGRLSPQEYADVIAAVLSINEIPAGKKELAPDPAVLAQIRIQ